MRGGHKKKYSSFIYVTTCYLNPRARYHRNIVVRCIYIVIIFPCRNIRARVILDQFCANFSPPVSLTRHSSRTHRQTNKHTNTHMGDIGNSVTAQSCHRPREYEGKRMLTLSYSRLTEYPRRAPHAFPSLSGLPQFIQRALFARCNRDTRGCTRRCAFAI